MKAVIYARYSSDNQREESIEGQIRECTAFAEKNDITVLKHYIDRAYSARTDHRPAFQEMIKDSDKHLFDMVIVWTLCGTIKVSGDRDTDVAFPMLKQENPIYNRVYYTWRDRKNKLERNKWYTVEGRGNLTLYPVHVRVE